MRFRFRISGFLAVLAVAIVLPSAAFARMEVNLGHEGNLSPVILHGRETDAGPTTVLLHAKFKNPADPKVPDGLCTGVVVGKYVFTAGHCISSVEDEISAFTGPNPELSKPGLKVCGAVILGGKNDPGKDLAILELENPPAAFANIHYEDVFATKEEEKELFERTDGGKSGGKATEEGWIIGRGTSEYRQNSKGAFEAFGAGPPRAGDVKILGRGSSGFGMVLVHGEGKSILTSPDPSNTAEGDSGGPLIANFTKGNKVVGLLSGGPAPRVPGFGLESKEKKELIRKSPPKVAPVSTHSTYSPIASNEKEIKTALQSNLCQGADKLKRARAQITELVTSVYDFENDSKIPFDPKRFVDAAKAKNAVLPLKAALAEMAGVGIAPQNLTVYPVGNVDPFAVARGSPQFLDNTFRIELADNRENPPRSLGRVTVERDSKGGP